MTMHLATPDSYGTFHIERTARMQVILRPALISSCSHKLPAKSYENATPAANEYTAFHY